MFYILTKKPFLVDDKIKCWFKYIKLGKMSKYLKMITFLNNNTFKVNILYYKIKYCSS